MKNTIIAIAFIASAFVFEGCSRRTYMDAPPPPRVEVIPVAPSPRHVWVQGYYQQRHRQYVWKPGHYEVRHRR